MDRSARINYLFDKHLQRICSREELEELVNLLQEDNAGAALSGRMQELWEEVKANDTSYPVDWNKMYDTVIRSEERLPEIRIKRKRGWIRIAAAAMIIFSGSALYWFLNNKAGNEGRPHTATTDVVKPRDSLRVNKRQIIHLPDGSTVILNADTRLDYPSAFSGKTREIFLSGEAYFDIKHDPKKPFLVHTGKIVTKVLGTTFDIKAYPGDESIKVTVTRGKVQVLNENKSLGLITANQQISFSRKTEEYVEKSVDSKVVVAWKPEEIAFNDITMAEAAKRIELRFGTSVEFINPAIKNCRVTATFSDDDMLEEILTVICGVTRSDFSIQNNKISINGKGCSE
jgi:transmembrane sensor